MNLVRLSLFIKESQNLISRDLKEIQKEIDSITEMAESKLKALYLEYQESFLEQNKETHTSLSWLIKNPEEAGASNGISALLDKKYGGEGNPVYYKGVNTHLGQMVFNLQVSAEGSEQEVINNFKLFFEDYKSVADTYVIALTNGRKEEGYLFAFCLNAKTKTEGYLFWNKKETLWYYLEAVKSVESKFNPITYELDEVLEFAMVKEVEIAP